MFYGYSSFVFDEFVLKLQVFQNYPMLRLKNYVPINFRDEESGQPLVGPIFSSADPECMYGHFTGYNADSTRLLEGSSCEKCQLPIDQFQ